MRIVDDKGPMDSIEDRLKRIYAALDATLETDLGGFAVTRHAADGSTGVGVDFRGGLSDEELANLAHTAIYNVAHLHDHLRRWIKTRGRSPELVPKAVAGSRALQIIIDLANSDKHGHPRRDGGCSGLSPRLRKVERFMKMGKDDWSGLRFEADGTARSVGQGTVVISARVVDDRDNVLGDLQDLLCDAVAAWETLLAELLGSDLRERQDERRSPA